MAPGTFTLPGEVKPLLKGVTEGATWKPWALGGIGGRTETQYLPAKIGGRTIEAIDDFGRGAAFYSQLRQGASFQEAARAAREAMYDYGNLTKAERSVMRRVIPFYNFMRQNLPAQFEEIIKNPGGKLASTIKLTETLRNRQGYVPEQVGEGLAFPVGQRDETGRQQYLTHFGLPFEDAFRPFAPSAKESMQQLLSETNPLIKGPMELATGRSLFTGRPLRAPITGNVTLDTILSNSPAARLAQTARDVTRVTTAPGTTALKLTGPVRLQEANVEASERAAAREAIAEQLFGNPNVRTGEWLNVPKDKIQNLSPRELQLLRLYQSTQRRNQITSR